MNTLDWVILAVWAAVVLNAIVLVVAGERSGRRSAIWVITCPESRTSAVIEIGQRQAGSGVTLNRSRFEVKDCSLWPGCRNCLRVCLERLKPRPGGTLVLTDAGK